MSYYRFGPEDILNTTLKTYPKSTIELNGNIITGSVYLENSYIISQFGPKYSNLNTRTYKGYSQRKAGFVNFTGPFTASVLFKSAISGSTNNILFHSISGTLYPYYKVENADYKPEYGGTKSTFFRIIDIPSIYYDKRVLTGSFSASDYNSAGEWREIFDNGRGGVYSGSLTATLVGNIFYDEGIVTLTKPDLIDFANVSTENLKWRVNFKGINNIPIKIFNCRCPAGDCNASTNPTFYQQPDTGDYKNQKEIIMDKKDTYITTIGLYNDQFELVAMAKLSMPIKKELATNINFRLKIDM
jgi:hypothetical protein